MFKKKINGGTTKKTATKNKKGHTEIIFIIDRSGSMSSIAKAMEAGFEQFISKEKKSNDVTRVTQVRFDTTVLTDFANRDIKEVHSLQIQPSGMTALLDAMGDTITKVRRRYTKTAKGKRPSKVLFVIITDGHENSSRRFKRSDVNDLIEKGKKDYKWDFVFLGANIDSFAEGQTLGIAQSSTRNFVANAAGVNDSWLSLTRNYDNYKIQKSANQLYAFAFDDNNK